MKRDPRQDCAALSWTSERADTLFVCERVRKAAAYKRNPARAKRAIKHREPWRAEQSNTGPLIVSQ
jgi:hypothetical protein